MWARGGGGGRWYSAATASINKNCLTRIHKKIISSVRVIMDLALALFIFYYYFRFWRVCKCRPGVRVCGRLLCVVLSI